MNTFDAASRTARPNCRASRLELDSGHGRDLSPHVQRCSDKTLPTRESDFLSFSRCELVFF